MANTIDTIWWDHSHTLYSENSGLPVFRKQSHLPIETLIYNVAKHISLGLYTIAQNFCATPSTLTIMITCSVSNEFVSDLHLALELAVDPSFLDKITTVQQSRLIAMGLVLVTTSNEILEAPFRSLHSPDYPSNSISYQPPLHSSPPSPLPTDPYSSIGLSLLNLSLPPQAWRGARVGTDYGYGTTSTATRIIAEFGRQLGPALHLYRIISVVATGADVALVVEATPGALREQGYERKLGTAFQLLKAGGQPIDQAGWKEAVEVGLLEE